MYESSKYSTSLSTLGFSVFIFSRWVGMHLYLMMAFIYIPMITNKIEKVFIRLLATCISFFVRYLFNFLIHFSPGLFFFQLTCKSSLCILDFKFVICYMYYKKSFLLCDLPFLSEYHFVNRNSSF